MLFEKIQAHIWSLSGSAGAAPYTFLQFRTDDRLPQAIGEALPEGYVQGIAFFLWADYTVADMRDNLLNSKAYLLIRDEALREEFVALQMDKNISQGFLQWQYNQVYLAVGIACKEVDRSGRRYLIMEHTVVDCFRQSLYINGGILQEIILFQE